MERHHTITILLVSVAAGAAFVLAIEPTNKRATRPQPTAPPVGIAAKYPGDKGIARHRAVVFTDGFENAQPGKLQSKMGGDKQAKWDNAWGGCRVTNRTENIHGGKGALELEIVRPSSQKATSIGVHQYFKKGFDRLYLRYYAKYGKDTQLYHGGTHNGGNIVARAPGVPQACPGVPADGRNKFTVLLDTWRDKKAISSPGHLAIYCYHPQQRHKWGEHFFPSGRILPGRQGQLAGLLGKQFKPRPDVIPQRGRWRCYELMVQANTPGKRDGRIAFWVEGKLVGDFPGLRLRDAAGLKANRIGLGLYTHNNKVTKTCRMWFDDVVVATEYIGPMTPVILTAQP